MLEKIIVLSIMYILVLGTDIRKLRKSRFREKMIYFGVSCSRFILALIISLNPNCRTWIRLPILY